MTKLYITLLFVCLAAYSLAQGLGYSNHKPDTIDLSDGYEQSIIFYEYSTANIYLDSYDAFVTFDTYDLASKDSCYISMLYYHKDLKPIIVKIDGQKYYLDRRNGFSINIPVEKNSTIDLGRGKKIQLYSDYVPSKRNKEAYVELALSK